MKLNQRIQKALDDESCKAFLEENLEIIRDTILLCEKRMNRNLLILLFLVGLSELTRIGVIEDIELFGVSFQINKSAVLILALPSLIAYFSYLNNRQRALKFSLDILFSSIIKKRSSKISELELDDLLIAQLSQDVEYSLSFGKLHTSKKWMLGIQIFKRIISSLIPIIYLIYFYLSINRSNIQPSSLFWISLLFTFFFLLQSLVLIVNSIIENELIPEHKEELPSEN